MKKLVFIDNDPSKRAKEDLDYVRDWFEIAFEGTELEDPKSIELQADFHKMQREVQTKLLYDPNNVILSMSQYTDGRYNSGSQFYSFIESAARMGIRNRVYVDCTMSGRLFEYLDNLSDNELTVPFLRGIQQNWILGYVPEMDSFYKIEVSDLRDEGVFKKGFLSQDEVIDIFTEQIEVI